MLPRGSYATMLVKRLTTVAGADLSSQMNEDDDEENDRDLGHEPKETPKSKPEQGAN